MNRCLKIVRFVGIILLVMGIWFLLQNISYITFNKKVNVYTIFHFTGALLYILCGIGLLQLKNWSRYVFIGLMAYYLYRQIIPIMVFINRIRQGNIISFLPEFFIALFIIISIIFPITSLWFLWFDKNSKYCFKK